MGNGNSKGLSVNAKTIILILLFLNVGLTIKMVKRYQTTKDAGYVREQTFEEQMEKRVQKAFGSAEEMYKIVEDATRQKEEAERAAEALKEQDEKTKQLNKELEHAKKQLEYEKAQLQKSEKHKSQLLASLKEGVYQCEPGVEGKFTWVNQACAEMFGYKSPEGMIGTKVRNIYVDQNDRKRLVKKLEKDGVWRNFASFCKAKNGEQFYTERTSTMVKNAEGKPIRIEGIIRNITERKRQEAKLQREIEELKKKLKARK
ncbi:MAG: PAS domain-containing protein [Candidatus Scalindua sp.]